MRRGHVIIIESHVLFTTQMAHREKSILGRVRGRLPLRGPLGEELDLVLQRCGGRHQTDECVHVCDCVHI